VKLSSKIKLKASFFHETQIDNPMICPSITNAAKENRGFPFCIFQLSVVELLRGEGGEQGMHTIPATFVHLDVSKNRGTSKWMVYRENPIKMDDLGVPLFLETPTWKTEKKTWKPQLSETETKM